jgi:hypothetical protein
MVKGLLEIVFGLLVVALPVTDGPDVAERPGLPGPVADFGKEGQRLPVVVEGLLVAALTLVDQP